MDLSTVQDKLCKGDYENSSYFLKDMNLIFNNAKDYNQTRSQVRSGRGWEGVSRWLANLSDLIRSLFVCLLLLLTHNTCMSFILYTYMYDHTCILVYMYMYMLILHLRTCPSLVLHLCTCIFISSSSSYMYLHCNTCIFFSTGGFYSLVFIVIHVHVSIFVCSQFFVIVHVTFHH